MKTAGRQDDRATQPVTSDRTLLTWLRTGDVSIRYQADRDLFGRESAREGWGARLFAARMDDALDVLRRKRRTDGRWPLQAKHPGRVHFDMEKPGQPSRWNTLRAICVLAHFDALEARPGTTRHVPGGAAFPIHSLY